MNGVEEIKRQKDGLDVLEDLFRYARSGGGAIEAGDELRLRWYGIYTQRPVEDGFFMVRTRIPGGELTPHQLRTIGQIASDYGRDLVDVTVRQNIQFHWVRLGDIPDLLERLWAAGLSTTEACGDCVRNIVACPVAGVDAAELYDTREIVHDVNAFFVDNREFSNLPRKFKIAISGCALRCSFPEINDIGVFAVRDDDSVAFRARVGGGLSTTPRFSRDLGVLVQANEVQPLIAAVAAVFRDEGNRESRRTSRLKFLVEAWDVPRFRDAVEERLGYRLRRAATAEAAPVLERSRVHLGVHSQKQAGLSYAGIALVGGRTTGDGLRRIADLAEGVGSDSVRTTNDQNILVLDVPDGRVEKLERELASHGFETRGGWARRSLIACTGVQFCKLAVAETKVRAERIVEELERRVALDEPVRISVTGCPNSCGQHHICDIGLEGSVVTVDGEKREAFQVFLGGGVGVDESFGRRAGVRVESERLADALVSLLEGFKAGRSGGESFQAWTKRVAPEVIVGLLRGSM